MKSPGKMRVAISYLLSIIRCCLIFVLSLTSINLSGQQLWSEIQLNKSSVFIGEPIEVSVLVYTSTWFTSGVDPGNIKVDDASTVYFRSVSTSKSANGKTYSGVQMIFNVFPFEEGNLTFPSLDIEVETPAEGDYKGVRRIVKTKERIIKVKPIPPGFESNDWLVTTDLSVTENWSGNLEKVMVGDVLERRIIKRAQNTIAALIPFTSWDSVPDVSLYPKSPNTQNNRTKTSISASTSESVRYLFEKEGEIEIPEKIFKWWDPYQQKLYKRTLPSRKIQVKENPDLDILSSIRDSLATEIQAEKLAASTEKISPDYKSLGKRMVLVVMGLAIMILIVWEIKKLIKRSKKARQAYLKSESYYFKEFLKSIVSRDLKKIEKKLYNWIDSLKLEEPSLNYLLRHYSDKSSLNINYDSLSVREWKQIRKNYLSGNHRKKDSIWINP